MSQTIKIIEIIGPPGVGKSTIYKALCKSWNQTLNWIYQDALLAPVNPGVQKLNEWLEYRLRIALGKNRAKSLPVDYGLRFINNNADLATLCWNHLADSDKANENIDKRFRSAFFLFNDFCRYQAIKERADERACVIEEGFLQKSFLINNNEQLGSSLLDSYLALVPLPYAIIYINVSDTSVIIDRLQKRTKVIASQIGKDSDGLLKETQKWQYTHQLILNRLEERSVLIYKVDAEKAVEHNINLINQILKDIS